jgi:hypothetical protein
MLLALCSLLCFVYGEHDRFHSVCRPSALQHAHTVKEAKRNSERKEKHVGKKEIGKFVFRVEIPVVIVFLYIVFFIWKQRVHRTLLPFLH